MAKGQGHIVIAAKSARNAAEHIRNIHGVTPILPLETIVRDGIVINLVGKCEHVQSMNTFKSRGSEWFVYNLMKEYHAGTGRFRTNKEKPVLVTASAGNHAQGVALAAQRYSLETVIFMPESTPDIKQQKVGEVGGTIRLVDGVFDDSLKAALEFKGKGREKTKEQLSRVFVPPFENPHIMVGQATVGVEILSQACPVHPDYMRVKHYDWAVPDLIISGLGGGGLISGIGSVVQEFNEATGNTIKVIGVQAEAADSMYQSIKAGELMPSSDLKAKTIADGIAVKGASERMRLVVDHYVDKVVLVSEDNIERGIAYLGNHPGLKSKVWQTNEVFNPAIPHRTLREGLDQVHQERLLNKVEGAAAAPYAAVVLGDLHSEINWREIAGNKKEINVVCVLTGSNIPDAKHHEITSRIGRPRNV